MNRCNDPLGRPLMKQLRKTVYDDSMKRDRMIDENDNDLLDLLTRYKTRERNTHVFNLKFS